jgi:hypothetical protein
MRTLCALRAVLIESHQPAENLSGELWKQNPRGLKKLKKRFFVLDRSYGHLAYYESAVCAHSTTLRWSTAKATHARSDSVQRNAALLCAFAKGRRQAHLWTGMCARVLRELSEPAGDAWSIVHSLCRKRSGFAAMGVGFAVRALWCADACKR